MAIDVMYRKINMFPPNHPESYSMKLGVEETLENLIKLSAEGASCEGGETLRQKDRAKTDGIYCLTFFPEPVLRFFFYTMHVCTHRRHESAGRA